MSSSTVVPPTSCLIGPPVVVEVIVGKTVGSSGVLMLRGGKVVKLDGEGVVVGVQVIGANVLQVHEGREG